MPFRCKVMKQKKQTAVIALGSNLAQPVEQVRLALHALAKLPDTVVDKVSSLYLTKPVGYLDQPDFVNAVCVVQTALGAKELLHALQAIELNFGRERSFRNAPRTLDLDIIDFNQEVYHDDELTLPHPRAHERGFVMCPLAEIAADYPIGRHGYAKDLAVQTAMQGVEVLSWRE